MLEAERRQARDKEAAAVLIVDDDEDFLEVCAEALERTGVRITTSTSSREALKLAGMEKYDLIFADLKMPEMDGLEFLERAMAADPELAVVLFTGFPTVETAVRALRIGVKDYLTKPFSGAQLREVMERVLLARAAERAASPQGMPAPQIQGFICGSPAMAPVLDLLNRIAGLISTVFITGETGTGKGVLAKAFHDRSRRCSKPFVAVNCGALPENLLESELFGHERGAFTGATQARQGLIESAEGGTLFLDEIVELPVNLQPKLLDVLQARQVRRIGSSAARPVDFRLIVASNRDAEQAVKEGRLREDLYFRINVVRIELPPLRRRQEDIPALAQHFIEELSYTCGSLVKGLNPEALETLLAHPWPGNVRELRNVIERALPLASGPLLTPADLLPAGLSAEKKAAGDEGIFTVEREAAIRNFEQDYIEELLRKAGGNVALACRLGGIPRNTFYRYLHKYSIQPEHYKKS
ncbi:MAG: sigma-54-dependent Fis family transcriptional regulator [Planctomycetes bacterium]|nr:sigma-54-dependent Fis family transcriptional regulator [Planctomycetota bacterium]